MYRCKKLQQMYFPSVNLRRLKTPGTRKRFRVTKSLLLAQIKLIHAWKQFKFTFINKQHTLKRNIVHKTHQWVQKHIYMMLIQFIKINTYCLRVWKYFFYYLKVHKNTIPSHDVHKNITLTQTGLKTLGAQLTLVIREFTLTRWNARKISSYIIFSLFVPKQPTSVVG